MNLALVHRRFTEHGGTERFVVGLARYLLERDHEVHIHCNEVREDLRAMPLTFHHLPMVKIGGAAKVLSLWRATQRIDPARHQVVMGFGRTIGHQVFRAGGGAHAAYLQACRPRWRLDPLAHVERALDRRAVLSAARVITPSQRAADDLHAHYAVPRERISVVHNGVDSARFRPGDGGGGLVFVGTGFARKGLAQAIAVAELLGRGLTVIGNDAGLDRWRRRHPQVDFRGPVQDLESVLPDFDVLLLPTRYEPYGNVCLEAMACGVVPVTTPWNGVTEVFPTEGLTGTTDAELAQAVEHALAGGDALRNLCRQRALDLPRERAYSAIEQVLKERAR